MGFGSNGRTLGEPTGGLVDGPFPPKSKPAKLGTRGAGDVGDFGIGGDPTLGADTSGTFGIDAGIGRDIPPEGVVARGGVRCTPGSPACGGSFESVAEFCDDPARGGKLDRVCAAGGGTEPRALALDAGAGTVAVGAGEAVALERLPGPAGLNTGAPMDGMDGRAGTSGEAGAPGIPLAAGACVAPGIPDRGMVVEGRVLLTAAGGCSTGDGAAGRPTGTLAVGNEGCVMACGDEGVAGGGVLKICELLGDGPLLRVGPVGPDIPDDTLGTYARPCGGVISSGLLGATETVVESSLSSTTDGTSGTANGASGGLLSSPHTLHSSFKISAWPPGRLVRSRSRS